MDAPKTYMITYPSTTQQKVGKIEQENIYQALGTLQLYVYIDLNNQISPLQTRVILANVTMAKDQ